MRGLADVQRVDHGRADPVTEIEKTQAIRLADVFFIGPVMIYAGDKLERRGDRILGAVLALLGAATVIYNAKNYVEQERDA